MAMQVKTYLAPSAIEGIGLFAAEPIAEGTVVWRFDPPIDQTFSREAVATLPELARDFVARYAYFDERLGLYVFCGDNARFMNHASAPNVRGAYPEGEAREGIDVACRAIAAGEEITCDYESFDLETARKMALERRDVRGAG